MALEGRLQEMLDHFEIRKLIEKYVHANDRLDPGRIAEVYHADSWDELMVEGDLKAKDGLVRLRRAGRTMAVASLFRDLESLQAEAVMEQVHPGPAP